MQKSKSGRDGDRKNDTRGKKDDQRRTDPISDEQLNTDVKKLFSEYVSQKEAEFERQEEEGEEPPKPFDVFKFKRFIDHNGRKGSQVLYALFQGVFDDNIEMVSEHLQTLLNLMNKEKVFQKQDFTDGLSKLIQNFGELSMDVPQIHRYLFDAVIKPLTHSKSIMLKFLKWIPPDKSEEKKAEGDEG